MKITISSPDGLGDFILRADLIRSLQSAGHQLQIFMRQPAAEFAKAVFPWLDVRLIEADPYSRLTRSRINAFSSEHRQIRAFGPDLYLAALFHINFFDQIWFQHGRRAERAAGFRCLEDFWGSDTTCDPFDLAKYFSPAVGVASELAEVEKNRLLAGALLEREIPARLLRIDAPTQAQSSAKALMASLGLSEGNYWITCMGSRRGLESKDWGEENWASFLGKIASGQTFVFLGNSAESDSIERIRARLPRDVKCYNLAAQPPDVATSFALAGFSAGFIGRDSGVMHMAAAAGRPVLAIFSGAHWGRFFPSVESGVVVGQKWPCRGGGADCAHDGAYCIRDIPESCMLEGWSLLQSRPQGLTILDAPMDESRLAQIACEASMKYARLAQECRRWQQNEARPASLLDALGMRIRSFGKSRK